MLNWFRPVLALWLTVSVYIYRVPSRFAGISFFFVLARAYSHAFCEFFRLWPPKITFRQKIKLTVCTNIFPATALNG